MNTSDRLAQALSHTQKVVKTNESNVLHASQIQRADRELLLRTGWIQKILKGWYLLVQPGIAPGDSSVWYASFWNFLRLYLQYRFANAYCLSAESSLDLLTASPIIPSQVIVIVNQGGGASQALPFNTSLFVYADPHNLPKERSQFKGLYVMSLSYAICKVSPTYFQKNPKEALIALSLLKDLSELTHMLVKYNFKTAAARILGAYEAVGDLGALEELKENLLQFGWKVSPENPFLEPLYFSSFLRSASPHAARICSLWSAYREQVILHFPKVPGLPSDPTCYLERVEDLYQQDAYNSLSIEGYQVDQALIERVQNNGWNPEMSPQDTHERNALAARGYYEVFLEIKKSLSSLFQGMNSGEVVERDLKRWYQSLFSPLVKAGILRQTDLLGYRKAQVYIRGSRHIPYPKETLVDAMNVLFDCLKQESHPAVRAVLGHYFFVFIHPYMDGNGRLGRFLMNFLFASGGYPWVIVHVANRTTYLNALEIAGVECNIAPFAHFIAQEMHH